MNWLDANADGLAAMLYVFAALGVFLLIALAIEFWAAADMRRRRRQREALRRYTDSIIGACWRGPEARQ
jgi:hypothetical protein